MPDYSDLWSLRVYVVIWGSPDRMLPNIIYLQEYSANGHMCSSMCIQVCVYAGRQIYI